MVEGRGGVVADGYADCIGDQSLERHRHAGQLNLENFLNERLYVKRSNAIKWEVCYRSSKNCLIEDRRIMVTTINYILIVHNEVRDNVKTNQQVQMCNIHMYSTYIHTHFSASMGC